MLKRQVLIGCHYFVSAFLLLLTVASTFSSSDELFIKSFIINVLIIIFPIIFLIQGAICAMLRANKLLSLFIPLATFLLIIFVWLNSSAFIYLLVYILFWLIGFGVTSLIRRLIHMSQ